MEWANAGNPIIIEKFNPHYSDYPYGMFPLSSTYNFNPKKLKGLDDVGKKSIIGIETPIWTEYITRFIRCHLCVFQGGLLLRMLYGTEILKG